MPRGKPARSVRSSSCFCPLCGQVGVGSNAPVGMADSVSSLPAMPSKSVPGTPFGVNGHGAQGQHGSVKRSGTSPNLVAEGLSQSQRGFSNPDLARTYGRTASYPEHQQRVSRASYILVRNLELQEPKLICDCSPTARTRFTPPCSPPTLPLYHRLSLSLLDSIPAVTLSLMVSTRTDMALGLCTPEAWA